nr:MAG: ORF1 [Torque teno midi virus]
MPFWWSRRNRWWPGRRRTYYKRKRNTFKRRRRRPFYKNRRRRPARRRRRRRKRVRRKLKKINLKQWQPDRIVKCRITGLTVTVLGGQGKQFVCYTDDSEDWVPAKAPGGGGFGVESFSLQYLYEEYKMGNNRWSKSNIMSDLVRYSGCRFTFYRHPYTDFIVHYSRQPPFKLEKYTYCESHPHSLLLKKHKKVIPSLKTKPWGKRYVKIKIGPPKLMSTKWFFQETFTKYSLLKLTAAACDLRYAHLGCCNTNQLISLLGLDLQFYTHGNWGNAAPPGTNHYNPQGNMAKITCVYLNPNKPNETTTITIKEDNYNNSVSYDFGWFQPKLLQAWKVNTQNVTPMTAMRYNPTIDDGKNNAVWFSSTLTVDYNKPNTDKDLIIEGEPLWKLFYGFTNYVQKIKGDPTFLKSYVVLVQSPYIFPFREIGTKNYHLPLDKSFVSGKGPYNDTLTQDKKQKWFPTLEHQQESINAFVCCGPYIPKYDNQKESTWELHGRYDFFFKWGGSQLPDENVADPSQQAIYDTPNTIKEAIQIINPEKQKAANILHCWDYRRGYLTKGALKRVLEDQETDTDFQPDADSLYQPLPRKKKKKALETYQQETEEVQNSLLCLCEEDTYQEIQQTPDLLQLIQQQQQQQRDIKQQLLTLIADLKMKQKLIQLQTGLLE